MIILTEKAKEAINEDLEFYLDMDEEKIQLSDMGLILFVRKQSCSPMTDGGHLEIGVAVEPLNKYKNNPNYTQTEILKEIRNIPVFIEDKAREMLGNRDSIEIDSRGALEKELLIKNGPIKDLGSCKVVLKREK